ncbi:MarR family winged helix-turn-helix transcriptional regulator [Leisingera aquaemixtae]|jgi:DNA-binding MarR family transcriptional regulator|uniref:MarR family transcriptional regulator n=1 Tax=Leisingera aquaemixtae TaxID=1396826 RepID=A0A0P1H704_9RHOB|nr:MULTISPECIES: MarR family transcriptional regulator [Leisingera]QDI77019.1 MarR family transcriptional regulator [Leisingera aquaemixtae]UWQ25280.1 MarR family transcriptional regulator [Leisingera aquaemixtae]UWQ41930.1 MarR family transcriptional regulator [Leisingera aquaemixtae]UWQ46174.1 MarR family transcriptional regulator [Leisingera aquaemixtae]CUH98732.1 Nicotinate degradation protein R [Leisingera aquaemixtae]
MDHVDFITQQWGKERPDLDVTAMGVIGRVARLYLAYQREMHKTFAEFGLNAAKFDVLATLRRSGAPYTLSPGELLKATMVASGTMTNRIDRLEADGLVKREVNPQDSRSFLVGLTEEGFALIDRAVTAHVQTQTRLLAGLNAAEAEALTTLLSKAQAAADQSDTKAPG